jgi:tetratricopeptide (TPR) repeat protein
MKIAALIALTGLVAAFQPASAAHATPGTPVANLEMPTLEGGKAKLSADVDANVLVFLRPDQDRSSSAIRELARCQRDLAGKSIRWVVIVSASTATPALSSLLRDSGFAAQVLLDGGDTLYGSLGLDLHPVVLVLGRDQKLAAYEPFRALDYCAIVSARIRHLLREISDAELNLVLDPPKATQGGSEQVARRYRAFADMQFRNKDYDKALDSVRKSLARDPLLVAAHVLLGEILLAQGKNTEAASAFRHALTLDSSNAAAREGLQRCQAGG